MAQACADAGRIEKLDALLQAAARADYIETTEHVPPTPLIGLARSRASGIQRYWIARALRAAGGSAHTNNDYQAARDRAPAGGTARHRRHHAMPAAGRAGSDQGNGIELVGLVAAVLRSEDPAALGQMLMVKKNCGCLWTSMQRRRCSSSRRGSPTIRFRRPRAAFVRLLLRSRGEMQRMEGGDLSLRAGPRLREPSSSKSSSRSRRQAEVSADPDMVAEMKCAGKDCRKFPKRTSAEPSTPAAAPPRR